MWALLIRLYVFAYIHSRRLLCAEKGLQIEMLLHNFYLHSDIPFYLHFDIPPPP